MKHDHWFGNLYRELGAGIAQNGSTQGRLRNCRKQGMEIPDVSGKESLGCKRTQASCLAELSASLPKSTARYINPLVLSKGSSVMAPGVTFSGRPSLSFSSYGFPSKVAMASYGVSSNLSDSWRSFAEEPCGYSKRHLTSRAPYNLH